MYFLLLHWVPATWRSRAQTSIKAELPSGKLLSHECGGGSPVESFNNVVGTDTGPVFTGKIAVSQRFLNAIFYLLGSLFQLHRVQLLHHGFGFLTGSFLVLLGVDRLEHLGHQLHFGTRRHREHIAVKVDRTSLVFGFGEHFSHSLQHTKAFVANNEFHPFQTAAAQP